MENVLKKPFYGLVVLGNTIVFSAIELVIGSIVFLFFSTIIGIIMIIIGIYTIVVYAISIHLISPTKTLDQSDILKLKGDELVLDAGCGLGRATIGIAKQLTNGKVIGVDIWDKKEIPGNSVEKAYENAEIEGVTEKVVFQFGDVFDLQFPDEYFDVVICVGLVSSFYNDEKKVKALKELHRVLKLEGFFLIREPISHLKSFIIISPLILLMKLPSKDHWRELIERVGFRFISYMPHPISGSFLMEKTKNE
jgi:ubiquinone/menaquinone biosynthesis C-methylase UbiE